MIFFRGIYKYIFVVIKLFQILQITGTIKSAKNASYISTKCLEKAINKPKKYIKLKNTSFLLLLQKKK